MSDGTGLAEAVLGLDGFKVLGVAESEDELVIAVETTASAVGCWSCGMVAECQDRVRVDIRDLACFRRPARLVWSKRRWRCRELECPAKTWTERSVHVPPRAVLTCRAGVEACRQVGELARPVSGVADELGVCWWTVMHAVERHGRPLVDDPARVGPVAALGVDETSFLKANREHPVIYATGLVDLNGKKVIDMVQGNAAKDVRRWCAGTEEKWLKGINVVATDLAESYRAGLSPHLDHAVRVADPFHLVRVAARRCSPAVGDIFSPIRRGTMSKMRKLGVIGTVTLVVTLVSSGSAETISTTRSPTMRTTQIARTVAFSSAASPASSTRSSMILARMPAGLEAVELIEASRNVVYVVGTLWGPTGGSVELFRSADGGGSFREVTTPRASRPTTREPLGDLGFQFEGAERGVAFVGSSVLVTNDGARSWHRADGPVGGPWVYFSKGSTVGITTTGSVAYGYAIHCSNGVSCPSYRLYRSTNWFSSWVEVPAPDSGNFNAAGGISLSAFGARVWLVVGSGETQPLLFSSTNEGRSFGRPVAVPGLSCGFAPFSARVGWMICSTGMDEAFFRSIDGGANLTRLHVTGSGTGGTELWPVSGSMAFFRTEIGAAAGFFRTTNGGRSFVRLKGLPVAFGVLGRNVVDITFAGPRHGLALLSQGSVFRTSDGGTRWTSESIGRSRSAGALNSVGRS